MVVVGDDRGRDGERDDLEVISRSAYRLPSLGRVRLIPNTLLPGLEALS